MTLTFLSDILNICHEKDREEHLARKEKQNILVPFFAGLTELADRLPWKYCFIISLKKKQRQNMISCHVLH